MLTITEQQDVSRLYDTINRYIDDDVYEKAEEYSIEEVEETYGAIIKLYDAKGEVITSIEVDDYDIAVEVLRDIFDVDDEDLYDEDEYDEDDSDDYLNDYIDVDD